MGSRVERAWQTVKVQGSCEMRIDCTKSLGQHLPVLPFSQASLFRPALTRLALSQGNLHPAALAAKEDVIRISKAHIKARTRSTIYRKQNKISSGNTDTQVIIYLLKITNARSVPQT